MMEPKTIYCPQCGRKVMAYDGKSTMNQYAKCKKCLKMVCFYPEKNETEIKRLPKRTTSSGMTFL